MKDRELRKEVEKLKQEIKDLKEDIHYGKIITSLEWDSPYLCTGAGKMPLGTIIKELMNACNLEYKRSEPETIVKKKRRTK